MAKQGILEEPINPSDRLLTALAQAEDTVSRLDARVSASELALGWRARIACHEAVAWQWNAGELAPLEEVVLHDARLGQGAPEIAVSRAVGALVRRRRAERRGMDGLEDWAAISAVVGRRSVTPGTRSDETEKLLAATAPRRPESQGRLASAPSPIPYLASLAWPPCPFDQDDDVFSFWSARLGDFAPYPALLQAAAALDLWQAIQPLARETDVGALILEARLKRAGRLTATPLLVELGRRKLSRDGRYWNGAAPAIDRAVFWLQAFAAGARNGMTELDLMAIARQRLNLALKGRRLTSHLPALAELLLRAPVVSAPIAAEVLGVTPQAARTMLDQLSGIIREVTGRKSYRVWRI